MNVLIDTHILIWALTDTHRLRPAEKNILLSDETIIHVSTISLWELSLKYSLGKLKLRSLNLSSIVEAINRSGYNIITLMPAEAIEFHQLPRVINTDPFDRMLIWQAIMRGYYFMSRDNKMKAYTKAGLQLIPAR